MIKLTISLLMLLFSIQSYSCENFSPLNQMYNGNLIGRSNLQKLHLDSDHPYIVLSGSSQIVTSNNCPEINWLNPSNGGKRRDMSGFNELINDCSLTFEYQDITINETKSCRCVFKEATGIITRYLAPTKGVFWCHNLNSVSLESDSIPLKLDTSIEMERDGTLVNTIILE